MIITLSPQDSSVDTTISIDGQVLTYNGADMDFSGVTLDGEVEGENPVIGLIKNINGVIHVSILYPYNRLTSDAMQSINPDDYIFNVTSGEVPSPIQLKST